MTEEKGIVSEWAEEKMLIETRSYNTNNKFWVKKKNKKKWDFWNKVAEKSDSVRILKKLEAK